jgi:hypothetical protein
MVSTLVASTKNMLPTVTKNIFVVVDRHPLGGGQPPPPPPLDPTIVEEGRITEKGVACSSSYMIGGLDLVALFWGLGLSPAVGNAGAERDA